MRVWSKIDPEVTKRGYRCEKFLQSRDDGTVCITEFMDKRLYVDYNEEKTPYFKTKDTWILVRAIIVNRTGSRKRFGEIRSFLGKLIL